MSTDAGWWKTSPPKPYSGCTMSSCYVEMSDGTKIAIDIFLPAGIGSARVPTVLSLTPYYRSAIYRAKLFAKLAAKLAPAGNADFAEALTPYGYAFVSMDLRGSGASFGQKKSIFWEDVVRDGSEMLDWIVTQPWSDGTVAATGVSAVGMTSQWLSTSRHPALKAIAPRFTVWDIFAGTHPGGLSASRFVGDIGEMLRAMDGNRLADMAEGKIAKLAMRTMIDTIRPADEDTDRSMLAAAVRDHEKNEYFDKGIVMADYRDTQLDGSSVPATLDTQSPATHGAAIRDSGVSVYLSAGWLDGAFGREMLAEHMTVGGRIVIGPWGHGARWYSSPVTKGKIPTKFDHVQEMVRFFDLHLRGIDHGIGSEDPIHYFTMGEEQWKSTPTWPPASEPATWFFRSGGTLDEKPGDDGFYERPADGTFGSSVHSRFGKHLGGGRTPVRPANLETLMPAYTTAPLERDTEVTGFPVLHLHASSTHDDGAFVVFLMDVAPDGAITYVTDGQLRASDRQLSDEEPPYAPTGPHRTFNSTDVKKLVPGEVAELAFDLFPVSWLFRAGHSIRLGVAFGDKDNLAPVPSKGPGTPVVRVHHGESSPSRIVLPVVTR